MFSQRVILQHTLYHKIKVGCKGLTGIQQRAVLWKGGDSSDEQVKVCDMNFYIKHAVILRFENVYLFMYNKECVVEITPNIIEFGLCYIPCSHSQ